MADKLRRKRTPRWKHVLGKDRKFTGRVSRAIDRNEYTAPKEK